MDFLRVFFIVKYFLEISGNYGEIDLQGGIEMLAEVPTHAEHKPKEFRQSGSAINPLKVFKRLQTAIIGSKRLLNGSALSVPTLLPHQITTMGWSGCSIKAKRQHLIIPCCEKNHKHF
jgi:hypothetical protein